MLSAHIHVTKILAQKMGISPIDVDVDKYK